MSKEPEEIRNPEEDFLDKPVMPDASEEFESSVAHNTEKNSVNERVQAIKAALKERERLQQEEALQSAIADKIKRYKSGHYDAEESNNVSEKPETEKMSDSVAVQPAYRGKHFIEETTVSKEEQPVSKPKQKSKKKKKKKSIAGVLFPQRGDGILECFRKIVFLSSSVVFVVCLGLIGDYFWENHKNAELATEMRNLYVPGQIETEEIPTEGVSEEYEYYGILANAKNLLDINPDVVGWLSIPGTSISYPLMQRKNQEDGNDYYLTRNIRLEESRAGSIFLDFRANFDYVINGQKQADNSENLIIYGHNMRDYSMFGSLKDYINYDTYYQEHPIIELNSNYRKYKYKIFGMIIVDIEDETETKFDYWNKIDFEDEEDFYNYVNEIKRRTQRLTNVDVKYGDQILALSTCNGTFDEGRLVIFARLVRDGEELYENTETSTANPNIKWPSNYYRWNGGSYNPDDFIPYG